MQALKILRPAPLKYVKMKVEKMKNKTILFVALAATVALGACCMAPREHHYAAANHSRTVYQVPGNELGSADVRKVQKSLTEEGFYHGKIDGVWGAETSQAILDYQTVRHPGQTDVTVDTLEEFGVRMDQDRYNARHVTQ